MPTIERDLNNTVNKTTRKTPFELLHGYRPTFNDGVLKSLTAHADNIEWTDPHNLQEQARQKIEAAQANYKRHYDRKHAKAPSYSIGEIVYMRKVPDTPVCPLKPK